MNNLTKASEADSVELSNDACAPPVSEESYATKAEQANDVFVMGDIIRHRRENEVLKAKVRAAEEALKFVLDELEIQTRYPVAAKVVRRLAEIRGTTTTVPPSETK